MIPQPTPERIDAYLHGLLQPFEAREIERLVEQSPEWNAAMEEGRRRLETLHALPRMEASEALIRRTTERVVQTSMRRRSRVRRFVGAMATITVAGILALLGLHRYYDTLRATPIDLQILGQNELHAGSNASLRVHLTQLEQSAPLEGIPVQMFLVNATTREEFRLADFRTDDAGSASPRFTLPEWPSGQYSLKVLAETASGREELLQPVRLKRESQLMLSSDKPLYQPGQTIRLRALALRRPDLKPIADAETNFSITDPQGNVIFKKQGTSSRFGIASADCPLATEILQGAYTISCRVGDTESSITVEVDKYVLPKFRVAVETEKPYYLPGQRVQATVQADYFFGKPVTDADVHVVVQRTDVEVETFFDRTMRTNDDGRLTFDFSLPDHFVGQEGQGGDATFQLVASVADPAGQKHSVAVTRTVTSQPLRVEVIPESGTLVKGMPNRIYVLTTYPDGRPAKCRVTINQEPEALTNDLGVAALELTPETNSLGITVAARDGEGRAARVHRKLTVDAQEGDFLFRTDKAVYRGGETMQILAKGGGREPVFVDLIKDRQTLLTRTLEMSAGGELAIDLPPDCFGVLQVLAYRLNRSGHAMTKTRTVFVEAPKTLKVSVNGQAEQYRPGETARLTFTLTDSDGNPTPGALSLAAVDEAVFHVLKQRPGLEGVFFNLDQKLLEPVYAIYPWSPFDVVAPPNDDDRRILEQALFCTASSSASRRLFETSVAASPPWAMEQVVPNGFGVEPMAEEGMVVMDAMPPGLQGENGSAPMQAPLTLTATTYPLKDLKARQDRSAGLQRVAKMRNWFIAAWILGVLAGFAAFKPRAFLITMGISACLAVVSVGTLLALPRISPRAARMVFNAMPESAKSAAQAVGAEFAPFGAMADEVVPASEAMAGLGGGIGMDLGTPEAPVRVRQQFPETLLWQPQLITDDQGRATLEVPLADSITNWRLTASAVSAGGRLGAMQGGIRVFQPFFVDLNLPVALTRNDEVELPVVVYNYLDQPQSVEILLEADEWYELLDSVAAATNDSDVAIAELPDAIAPPSPTGRYHLELKPNEVRSLRIPLRAKQVGRHSLQATARSRSLPGVADALRREIAVEPDGQRVEVVHNGSLGEPVSFEQSIPENAIPGSAKAIVKLYPSSFSQVVEGMDAIFQRPYGCFEQTSSTTYPNILALDYLKQTKKSSPAVEAKARQFIHLGYQRLLTFEVEENGQRGGFDWFGNPPANQTLTAYGLHEFQDMSKVHDVDPVMIQRTRDWLMERRQPDGSWKADVGMLNDGLAGSVQRGNNLTLATTAYISWALFRDGNLKDEATLTLNYLLAHRAEQIEDPYVLAMVANALLAIRAENAEIKPYLDRIESLKKSNDKGTMAWWELPSETQTCFHGSGESGNIELTALATLALLEGRSHPGTATKALSWLVSKKDPQGTWHSTQATILALKALIQGTLNSENNQAERTIELLVDGQLERTIVIPVDQMEVVQLADLSSRFQSGTHRLEVRERTEGATGFQVTFTHFLPDEEKPAPEQSPLNIEVTYDRTTLAVNDAVVATARVTNQMPTAAPMIILDLPVPAGFRLAAEPFEEMVAAGKIAKFQQTARSMIVYLRALAPNDTLTLTYRLEATMPVRLTLPAPVVYEYYNPDRRGAGKVIELTVQPRTL